MNSSSSLLDTIRPRGWFEVELRDKNGKLKFNAVFQNLVTNAGFAALAGLAGNVGSVNAFTYLAIGTGTTAATASDTTLETEITTGGGARASATVSRQTTTVSNDTLQLVYQWTFSSSFAVTEVGIFNAASSGDMLARSVFSAVNVVNTDTLSITYKVPFA